ncbi:GAL4 [Aspergillus sclerotialis]|uniref:GAL4 n=1 Tax=Aspergillus sclerotialis TaxID=2070753 RepID=A0A3A3A6V1_9EURO|nr:GAL4 [Aspergillus sclerotialis]
MNDRKRRSRTGCLTCRTRRVKCDERKPTCERCEFANVECAGYAGKRILTSRRQTQSSTSTTPTASPSDPGHAGDATIRPQVRLDGLPLIALPNNPTPSQLPHSRARDVLAFHQFLFRTMPLLFPPDSLFFWRDYVCQEAWGIEYVFDAIVALGCMHRATLLLSQQTENDRDHGFGAKVIALQMYSNALKGVSDSLASTQISMALLLGVLILFAYVECFDGNVPATIRHIHMANHYFQAMCSRNTRETEQFKTPIELCLHDLDIVRRVTLPDLKVIRMISPLYRPSIVPSAASVSLQEFPDFSPKRLLQQLLDIGSMDGDIKPLIWCPVAAHRKLMPEEKIVGFIKQLKEWKNNNGILFQKLGVDEALSEPVNFDLATLADIPIPPPPHANLPKDFCLVLSLYVFYRMRLFWSLSIYNGGESNLELDTYHFTYQLLRFVMTALDNPTSSSNDIPFGCEGLRVGLSPILFLAGQSCPRPTWLRWILFELDRSGREGVCNSKAFASSLEVLSTLEKRVGREPRWPDVEYFTPPHRRVISVIFPDLNGRDYVTYYAQPRPGEEIDSQESHIPLCIARWESSADDGRPAVSTCDGTDVPFSEWVMDQPLVKEWAKWLTFSEFDLNQTLHDHINGSRLLLDRDRVTSSKW